MKSLWGKKLAVALLSTGGATALVAAAWAGDAQKDAKREMQVIFDSGAGERLEIDDLGELEIGESRSYVTDSGKTAVVSRDEKGYEVELDGKTIRIGDGAESLVEPGKMRHQMKRIEIADDGEGDADGDKKRNAFVISNDPEHEVVFIDRRQGEHGFTFDRRGGSPPFGVDGLVSRLEKNEKFLSLDDATRELVREAVRESSPDLHWLGLHEAGEEGAMKVIVRERVTKEDDDEEE